MRLSPHLGFCYSIYCISPRPSRNLLLTLRGAVPALPCPEAHERISEEKRETKKKEKEKKKICMVAPSIRLRLRSLDPGFSLQAHLEITQSGKSSSRRLL